MTLMPLTRSTAKMGEIKRERSGSFSGVWGGAITSLKGWQIMFCVCTMMHVCMTAGLIWK